MASRKSAAASQRRIASEGASARQNGSLDVGRDRPDGDVNGSSKAGGLLDGAREPVARSEAGLPQLVVCIAGIYASFLSWALLQERITTTPHGPHNLRFSQPVVLNTLQSSFAALTGYIYVLSSRTPSNPVPVFPSRDVLLPLSLVAVTSSLASPFGYASLKHVGYVTFILAKSCKLVPVMALHVGVFRKKYPLYKYAVVGLVTLGVAIFTLHHDSGKKKGGETTDRNVGWGLFLLAVNLLFDGLTNSTQDYVFGKYKGFTGPQMMCAQNIMSTVLTSTWLLLAPYISRTSPSSWLGLSPGSDELRSAVDFVGNHASVGWDILAFAACGAIGQVFIFYTLSQFSSLLLVTVTVTRKMLTMILSVLWFGHRLSPMQWLGVAFVFGGVGAEALIQRREKVAKEREKKRRRRRGS